jgi:ferredoxin
LSVRRGIQILCFVAFLLPILTTAFPPRSPVPADLFLRTDPSAAIGTVLATRTALRNLWPALAFLALTPLLGRFYCAWVCPMGTTLDAADRIVGRGPGLSPERAARWRIVKYRILSALIAAALFGVSLVFLVAPIPLVTRLFALILHPFLAVLADMGLTAVRPVADVLDLTGLAYARIAVPRYALGAFTALTFVAIFGLARFASRFWCRHLCPAGALFALCARKPAIRRRVSDDCIDCGRCIRDCPMDAIPADPRETRAGECIACETCVRTCPVEAIRFGTGSGRGSENRKTEGAEAREPVPLPGRRRFIAAGMGGAGAAMLAMTGLRHRTGDGPGQVLHPALIRPPGAVPETEFLRRCVGCGACMNICPTNTLQPVAFIAGLAGFFSPVVTPARGPCEPTCNACGRVCPTGAIRALSAEEKIWARVGTAQVLRRKCLAWEFDRGCLVCDEVCPYNAIDLRRIPGQVEAVPFVDERRCAGCGFCEHHCPVEARSAIIVEPMEALRLSRGSYREIASAAGMDLRLHEKGETESSISPFDAFESDGNGGLPPGFTE